MECERLKKQIKNWYAQVQDEAMAPARMVDFMRKHVDECVTCLADPIVDMEINRITELVLPPSKIPKAVRKEEEKKAPEEVDEAVAQDDEKTEDDVAKEDDDVDPDEDDEDDEI